MARTLRDLGLGDTGPRVPLEQHVCEVAPFRALADQRDLCRTLDRHLVLDEGGDLLRCRADEIRQGGTAVTENPRIAVLVGAERTTNAHVVEQCAQRFHRMRFRRVLGIVGDVAYERIRLRVLALQPRHEHSSFAVGAE